ncbi:MAG: FAD-dependent oxidoreductase [Ruminococcaceae bacterium]|nr:FAD-dependent oxidoreductase [Oscillospiraceae bacterium]
MERKYDVIIAGGGPAGACAAIAAAREGVSVLLIEQSGFLGGMATGGLVPEFCPYTDGENIIHNGLAKKILLKMKEYTKDEKDKFDYCAIDAEYLKFLLDDLVCENNVDVMFFTTIVGCDVDDNKNITSLTIANKQGFSKVFAKVFVDATGDADVAAMSGCEFDIGDENNKVQLPTLCFVLSNVNDESKENKDKINRIPFDTIIDMINDDEFPEIDDRFFCKMQLSDKVYGFNVGHVQNVDNFNVLSLSKGMINGRKKAFEYHKALKKYLPEVFGNSHLTVTAPNLGVRESRRIKGDYTLTIKDYIDRREFEDEIARNSYHLDLHKGILPAISKEELKNSTYNKEYKKGDSHAIPYRCLVPKDVNNLLVAGRSISCEKIVQSSIRIIPVCFVTGEAAGVAAAIISKENCDTHNVDVNKIKRKLEEYR